MYLTHMLWRLKESQTFNLEQRYSIVAIVTVLWFPSFRVTTLYTEKRTRLSSLYLKEAALAGRSTTNPSLFYFSVYLGETQCWKNWDKVSWI